MVMKQVKQIEILIEECDNIKLNHCITWCTEKFGPVSSYQNMIDGAWRWRRYTTIGKYKEKWQFARKEDAVLFALRWS
jgi:hypothetical protein